ncbi:MAG: WD40 repeat domain-containing protein [Terriglobia bacterium]
MTIKALASLALMGLFAGAPAFAQMETIPGPPPVYVWRHELRMQGHLALRDSPDGAFSPDGSTLAVTEKRRVILISLIDGHPVKILQPILRGIDDLEIQSASYVSPTRLFILASGVVKGKGRGQVAPVPELAFQWDIAQSALAGKLESLGRGGGFLPARYFPRIRYVALYKNSTFTLWNPVTDRAGNISVPELKHPPHLFAVSPDGHWMLLAQIETNSTPNPIVVSLQQRAFVNVLPGHGGTVLSMTFSRDGTMLETSCEDGKVRLWSVPGWKLLRTLSGNLGPVRWAEFSPHGRYVASAGEDDTVRIWETATGKLLQTLEESKQPLLTVAFSPDGRYLAATSQNEVHAWVRTAE